jgi:hypothetical protein
MKLIKYIEENLIYWIIAIMLFAILYLNKEVSTLTDYKLIKYTINLIPFFIVFFLIIYVQLLIGIDENIWEEFKEGRDFHIDKMMKKLKKTILLISIFNSIYISLIIHILLSFIENINLFKCFLLIIFSLSTSIYTIIHYLKLNKEYKN